MDHNVTAFQKKINGVVRLPVLAKNIQKILSLLSDENISYKRLAEEIGYYPELAARLISLANSVWMSPAQPIVDLETCCIRLGFAMVKSVSLAIMIASSFDSRRCAGFVPERFWINTMLVAETANLIAHQLPPAQRFIELRQSAQVAGLLHQLGLLWLADNLPFETDQALKAHSLEPTLSIAKALTKYVGADYFEVNAWLAEQWKLPEIISIGMRYHLDVSYVGQYSEITLLLRSAIAMVDAHDEAQQEIAELDELTRLDIDFAKQTNIYQQLLTQQNRLKELSKFLFQI